MTKVTKELKDRWILKQWVKDYLDDHDGDTIAWEKISKDPWLYDTNVTLEEAMILKLKDQCPRCGISARFHRDDCEFSMQQLMFREMESADRGIVYFESLTWGLQNKMKGLGSSNV
jgi:hypothetical protein